MKDVPIVLSMGDCCGIGPEIIAKLFKHTAENPRFLVLGDVAVMRRAVLQARLPLGIAPTIAQVESPTERVPDGCMAVMQVPGLPMGLVDLPVGQVHAHAGAAAAACVELGANLCLQGDAVALVTAPLNKAAMSAAGIRYPGHTEMLQALCTTAQGMPPVRMMLANPQLRTVLVTIHVSVRHAIDLITLDNVLKTIQITHEAAQRWGLPAPRIAVAGLNPHAGEEGLFGDEEILHIAPAIRAAQALGIDARGPIAPDTVFMRARHTAEHPGEFDVVVAMTHDHGLIPVKYLGVEQGVNVTLGLPFVRTSPDHGTAFDIAGQGMADESSLRASVQMARTLVAQ
mgnify:CR=1 FL=1